MVGTAEILVMRQFASKGFDLIRGTDFLHSKAPGIPDFYCKGLKCFIEVKSGNDTLSSDQLNWIGTHFNENVFLAILKNNKIFLYKIVLLKAKFKKSYKRNYLIARNIEVKMKEITELNMPLPKWLRFLIHILKNGAITFNNQKIYNTNYSYYSIVAQLLDKDFIKLASQNGSEKFYILTLKGELIARALR